MSARSPVVVPVAVPVVEAICSGSTETSTEHVEAPSSSPGRRGGRRKPWQAPRRFTLASAVATRALRMGGLRAISAFVAIAVPLVDALYPRAILAARTVPAIPAVAALAVPAVVALAVRLVTGPHPIDDAFITFRYARNLASGAGLVYNPGEWVLGTTAPLWALVLGLGYRLGATDLPWLATVLSAACDAAAAALIAALAVRIGWPPVAAALVGLAWAFNPMSISFATGGMESSLFLLVTLVVLTLAARRACVAAALLAGTATLVRPEGALLALTTVLFAVFSERPWQLVRLRRPALTCDGLMSMRFGPPRDRRMSWRPGDMPWRGGVSAARVLLAAAAPILLAAGVLTVVYGSPLPHSVAAKQVAYARVGPFDNIAVMLVNAGLPGTSTYLLAVMPIAAWALLALVGLTVLIALTWYAVPWLDQRGRTWQPFLLFGVLLVAFYAVVGLRGVRLFNWYLLPLAPLYLLAAAAGFARLARSASSRRLLRGVSGARVDTFAVSSRLLAVVVVGALLLWQLAAIDWHRPFLPSGETLLREHLFLETGRELALALPPSATIAAPEIGALGYASNRRILDTVGLVSPEALPYYPLPDDQLVTDNAIPATLIADQRPDAVVTLDAYAERTLLRDAAFLRDYQLVQRVPAEVWQSRALLVFRRVAAK